MAIERLRVGCNPSVCRWEAIVPEKVRYQLHVADQVVDNGVN